MSGGKTYDPAGDGAETDFQSKMSYSDYLALDTILAAQHTRTGQHDEMLFIIQHQTSELWMRLALHELNAAREHIRQDRFQPAFKMLSRIARISDQLNSAWDVLRPMTPSEYSAFRNDLARSSGFQSVQYRLIEYVVGNRNRAMRKPHEHRMDYLAQLDAELARRSLYDEVIAALAREGYEVDKDLLERDLSTQHQFSEGLQSVWKIIYQAPQDHWTFYELAEKLVDFEDYFRRWRFNHVTTVERIIGLKRGTGGTQGVNYLRKMLEVELFPELWAVRTVL